ncbi:hypothetical protein TI39_contig586g00008 [Zymoseptoria brevis]|uniref:Uncharacterized protein n=1 Tax=Zymoseptoria brevis TaxID=1047168 RepID=A0A0F4GHX1_9PEZI|nr:hypothetical protein TI39_contig586g00008 [Zymoseptoria brevis]
MKHTILSTLAILFAAALAAPATILTVLHSDPKVCNGGRGKTPNSATNSNGEGL